MSMAQTSKSERQTIRTALGNNLAADNLIAKLDGASSGYGQGNGGTLGTGSTLSVDETSAGQVHVTKIKFTNHIISMSDLTTNGSIGSKKIYTFPTAQIKMLGARTNLTGTVGAGISATATLKHSVGTAAAATNDTLSLTKANIIPSTNTTLSSSAGTIKGVSKVTAVVALTDNSGGTPSDTIAAQSGSYVQATQQNTIASLAAKVNELIALQTLNGTPLAATLDGTASAIDVYLNFGVADAGTTADTTLTLNGSVTLVWAFAGV